MSKKEIKGEFKRSDALWRKSISREPDAEFPPEKDRYHLYVAHACPWAHRTLVVRALKGLEDVISVTFVHPTWKKTKPDDPNDGHSGWVFANPEGESFVNTIGLGGPFPASVPGCEPDPILNAKFVRDIYEYCGDLVGTRSVPILFDKTKKTIVSNESSEIIRMLNSEFNDFAKNPELDLYPEDHRAAIDEVNKRVYSDINNGVYRCGFSKSQEAYDDAITKLTNAFDWIEGILQKSRYVAGETFTEADVRLFVTLLRFDEVYIVYFKTNTRSVRNSPAILNYCREIYQMQGVAETVSLEYIKMHYYTSHPVLNNWSIIPRGADFEALLKEPHNRE